MEKLNLISEMSKSLMDLKKKKCSLLTEQTSQMKNKSEIVRKMRLQEYKEKSKELDERENDLCQKTKQLVDELVSASDDTPFHKALIKLLKNLKGAYFSYLYTLIYLI